MEESERYLKGNFLFLSKGSDLLVDFSPPVILDPENYSVRRNPQLGLKKLFTSERRSFCRDTGRRGCGSGRIRRTQTRSTPTDVLFKFVCFQFFVHTGEDRLLFQVKTGTHQNHSCQVSSPEQKSPDSTVTLFRETPKTKFHYDRLPCRLRLRQGDVLYDGEVSSTDSTARGHKALRSFRRSVDVVTRVWVPPVQKCALRRNIS